MSTVETLRQDVEERLLAGLRKMRGGSRSPGTDKPKTTMNVGQSVADQVAATVGSWPFIIGQSLILVSGSS